MNVRFHWLAIGIAALMAGGGPASAQLRPRARVAPPAAPATPAADPTPRAGIPGPRDAAQEARREGRAEAREARREFRDSDIATTRAADLGLWFAGRGANGLTIADIAPQGAIAQVGFRDGDRIVSINGMPINSETQFVHQLLSPSIRNQQASIVVMRNGQQQTLTVLPSALVQGIAAHDPYYQYGMMLDSSNPNRVVVQRVFPRTPAFYAGLRAGDVISSVGGQRIANINAFSQALSAGTGNDLALQISRNNQMRNLDLELGDQTRTALRPNLDAETRLDGRAGAGTTPSGGPSSTTRSNLPGSSIAPRAGSSTNSSAVPPGTPTPPVPSGIPTTPPSTSPTPTPPLTPATPGAGTPTTPGGTPTNPSSGTPAAPGTPGTPGTSGTTGSPATPATPVAPGTASGGTTP